MTVTTDDTPRRHSHRPSLWSRGEGRNEDWFDEESLTALREYMKPLKRLRLTMSIVGVVYLGVFMVTGAGAAVLDAVGLDDGWVLQLVVVVAALSLGQTILGIGPEAWVALSYDKRHGVSNQTPGLFIKDQVKDFLITLVIMSAILAVVYAAIHAFDSWWILGWAGFFLLQLLMVFLQPLVIEPRFNKFTPLEAGHLRDRIEDVIAECGTGVSDISVMDGSKRSRRGNAYVSGFGPSKRVVMFDTILDWPAERIAQVVAHEIGHYRLKHIAKRLPVVGLVTLAAFGFVAAVGDWEWMLDRLDAADLGDPAAVPLFLAAFGLAMSAMGMVMAFASRHDEREADLEALEVLVNPTEMMALWPAMVEVNKAELEKSWWRRLNASHPEPAERMQFAWDWAQLNDVPATKPAKTEVHDHHEA
ncbi:MAG TPA: M48 family metallopeptidase [Acidimicrobiales bacterium]